MGPMSRRERIMSVPVLLAMFLWICGSNPTISLPFPDSNFINATMVVFAVISLMPVTGVIDFDDIVREKAAWEVFFYFTSLLTLSSGLNEIGFIKWVAEGFAKPLASMSPLMGMVLLVSFFFWIHADPDRTAAEPRQRPPGAGANFRQADRRCAQKPQKRRSRQHPSPRPHQARLCDL
jgi:di/tricarboxylate transporter